MFPFTILLVVAAQAGPPATWVCDDAHFADGVCDCGCGDHDDDCPDAKVDECERDGCDAAGVDDEDATACLDDDGSQPPPAGPSCVSTSGRAASLPASLAVGLAAGLWLALAGRRRRRRAMESAV